MDTRLVFLYPVIDITVRYEYIVTIFPYLMTFAVNWLLVVTSKKKKQFNQILDFWYNVHKGYGTR